MSSAATSATGPPAPPRWPDAAAATRPISAERSGRWREQARDLLRAEITLWAGVLDHGPAPDRIEVWDQLTHLWTDPDLAGLLDQESLDELSPAEHQEHRALGGEIDALIRRAQTIE